MLATDSNFTEKLKDVVGLYSDPLAHAVVLVGRCMQRHRHQEFIRFLNAAEVQVSVGRSFTSFSTIWPPTRTRR